MFKFFSSTPDERMKLAKSENAGEWIVKKGYSILYMGTKDKCKTFMNQAVAF